MVDKWAMQMVVNMAVQLVVGLADELALSSAAVWDARKVVSMEVSLAVMSDFPQAGLMAYRSVADLVCDLVALTVAC